MSISACLITNIIYKCFVIIYIMGIFFIFITIVYMCIFIFIFIIYVFIVIKISINSYFNVLIHSKKIVGLIKIY